MEPVCRDEKTAIAERWPLVEVRFYVLIDISFATRFAKMEQRCVTARK